MNQNPEQHFAAARALQTGTELREKNTFVLRKERFDVAALMIDTLEKSSSHLAPVFRLRPFAPVGSGIERDNGQAHIQFAARQRMVVFAIESRIAQRGIHGKMADGGIEQRFPEHTFVGRSAPRTRRKNQMRIGVAGDGKFCPVALLALFVLHASKVMPAGMSFFQTCRINRDAQPVLKAGLVHRPEPAWRPAARQNTFRCAAPFGTAWNNAEYDSDPASAKRRESPSGNKPHHGNRFSIELEAPTTRTIEQE